MPKYGLEGYHLIVTQNKTITPSDEGNSDKITIALQENRISELEQILSRCEEEITTLKDENSKLNSMIDYTALSEKAEKIFTELENVRCGVISDSEKQYTLLIGYSSRELSDSDCEHIKSWLAAETGSDDCELLIKYIAPETAEAATSDAEGTPEATSESEE